MPRPALTDEDIRNFRMTIMSAVTANTVNRLEQDEAGPRGPQPITVDAIKRVYKERGIVFFDAGATPDGGPGVRLKA